MTHSGQQFCALPLRDLFRQRSPELHDTTRHGTSIRAPEWEANKAGGALDIVGKDRFGMVVSGRTFCNWGSTIPAARFLSPEPMVKSQFQSMLQQKFMDAAGCPLCGEQWANFHGKVVHDAPAGTAVTGNRGNLRPDSAIRSRNCAIWQLFGIK
jgi:hypothetical protein